MWHFSLKVVCSLRQFYGRNWEILPKSYVIWVGCNVKCFSGWYKRPRRNGGLACERSTVMCSYSLHSPRHVQSQLLYHGIWPSSFLFLFEIVIFPAKGWHVSEGYRKRQTQGCTHQRRRGKPWHTSDFAKPLLFIEGTHIHDDFCRFRVFFEANVKFFLFLYFYFFFLSCRCFCFQLESLTLPRDRPTQLDWWWKDDVCWLKLTA